VLATTFWDVIFPGLSVYCFFEIWLILVSQRKKNRKRALDEEEGDSEDIPSFGSADDEDAPRERVS
jgi:hypothetical protein